jgi:hypothetical protein
VRWRIDIESNHVAQFVDEARVKHNQRSSPSTGPLIHDKIIAAVNRGRQALESIHQEELKEHQALMP